MVSEKLMPCPFCGGSIELRQMGDDKFVAILCENCQASGPNHYGKHEWNSRFTADEQVEPSPSAGAPLGAIENGRVFLQRLENSYDFQCEAGGLANCSDYHEAVRCFEAMAEWIYSHAPDALEPAVPATDAEPVAWLICDKEGEPLGTTLDREYAEWKATGGLVAINPLYTRPPENRLREALEGLLAPFSDDPCRLDHHGYCQAHFLELHCCVAEARAVLARNAGENNGG